MGELPVRLSGAPHRTGYLSPYADARVGDALLVNGTRLKVTSVAVQAAGAFLFATLSEERPS